jgi:hypothetical protein
MSTVLINILTEYIYSGRAVTPSISRLLMPYVAVDADSTTNIFRIPTRSSNEEAVEYVKEKFQLGEYEVAFRLECVKYYDAELPIRVDLIASSAVCYFSGVERAYTWSVAII